MENRRNKILILINKMKSKQLFCKLNYHIFQNSRDSELKRNFQPKTQLCRNEEGKSIGRKTEEIGGWEDYFEKLLNLVNVDVGGKGRSDINKKQ